MTQRMTFTQHQRNELQRYLDAKIASGRKAVFTKWALQQESLLLCHYDNVMSAYRKWLVFNQF